MFNESILTNDAIIIDELHHHIEETGLAMKQLSELLLS
jgi:hypothetical protein